MISVIIPAYRAHDTIARAASSLLAQTDPDWEAIVVSDDGTDYRATLAAAGIRDERFRFASTGAVGTGCHNARNAGLPLARGDFVAALDADDAIDPQRHALLRPVAAAYGAAADNVQIVRDTDGAPMYRAMGDLTAPVRIGIPELMALTAPLVPLIARAFVQPRTPGIEFAEDVVANIQLIDRLGELTVLPPASYVYYVRAGSIAHGDSSGPRFDEAYTGYIDRCRTGDGLGMSESGRRQAVDGFQAKRDLNRRFVAACVTEPSLTFQDFAARLRRGA